MRRRRCTPSRSGALLEEAFESAARSEQLAANWHEAQGLDVIGVPTFVIGDQIFWGNDHLDFVDEHLAERATR